MQSNKDNQTGDVYYENLVDFLVINSACKFETPNGIFTGKVLLEKMWLHYAPTPHIKLDKLNKLQEMQKLMWTTRRVKLEDNDDTWDVKIESERRGSNDWFDMGMRLA